MKTLEERVADCEQMLEVLAGLLTNRGELDVPGLEDLHAATVVKVKQAKERGGLSA